MVRFTKQDDQLAQWDADLGRCHGGIMRKGRSIVISTILALGAAGSILAGSAAPAVAASASSVHVVAMAPQVHYFG